MEAENLFRIPKTEKLQEGPILLPQRGTDFNHSVHRALFTKTRNATNSFALRRCIIAPHPLLYYRCV
jgi:hypothetical protein